MAHAISGTCGGSGVGSSGATAGGPGVLLPWCFSEDSAFIDLLCLPGCKHASNRIVLLPSRSYLKYH